MRELLEILKATLKQRLPCVYCAVVETRGSTPQKAGAVMLVFADGAQVGTLGGGCVEAEVRQRALRALSAGPVDLSGQRAEVFTFCLDDDYGWDDGLICGGRMTILADPLRPAEQEDYYARFQSLLDDGAGCIEAVALTAVAGLPVGARFLFDRDGRLVARTPPGEGVPEVVSSGLPALADNPGPSLHHDVAYLPVAARVTLLIVGGGHVGQAVARLAAETDFEVWIADDRAGYASLDRFPAARRRLVGDLTVTLKQLAPTLGASTYCLIVTRGHAHDEEALYHLAGAPAGYIGMIGSKRKIRLIYEDLVARGTSPAALERVHAPVGLDIGSQTVSEIAISILAELIAFRNLGSAAPRPRRRVALPGQG